MKTLLGAYIESDHFAGRVTRETDKAILIEGDVKNWIPKSVFFDNSEYIGEVDLNDGRGDMYKLEIPFWMNINRDPIRGFAH